MNKQLKFLSRTVFGMFIVLFFSVTMIQFVSADELRDNELNQRSIKNSYKIERGSILVDGNPIAFSTPTDDEFRFIRQYADGPLYAPITGYFSRRQGMTGLENAMNQDLSGLSGSQFFTRLMRTMTGEEPGAKAGCGYTVPVICIKTGRLSCMNTSRQEMHLIHGNS